jgi:hypothetical protein
MSADLSYQNVVHKRMGGTRLVIPTGCVQDIESGGALEIGGTKYIDTSGRVVQQYESKTSDDGGDILTNYGVSYLSPVALASTFVLPAGTANVIKTITVGNGSTAASGGAVVTVKSSGCVIIDASSSTALATITGTAYQSGSINLIAESTALWRVIGKPSTSLALS